MALCVSGGSGRAVGCVGRVGIRDGRVSVNKPKFLRRRIEAKAVYRSGQAGLGIGWESIGSGRPCFGMFA